MHALNEDRETLVVLLEHDLDRLEAALLALARPNLAGRSQAESQRPSRSRRRIAQIVVDASF